MKEASEDFEPVPREKLESSFFAGGRAELFERWVRCPLERPRAYYLEQMRRRYPSESYWKGFWQKA